MEQLGIEEARGKLGDIVSRAFLAGERKKGVGGSALLGIEGHAAPF